MNENVNDDVNDGVNDDGQIYDLTMDDRKHKRGRKNFKNPIKFQESLNAEQKRVKEEILQKDISVICGKAGSGKTFLAVQIALESLYYRECNNIIITRPTVSEEEIGFLPGDILNKMDPWVSPIHANIKLLSGAEKFDKLLKDGKLEIAPFAFMRGRTFMNSVVILDEAQNVSMSQMLLFLTRLGKNSKMIICGDLDQSDLKNGKKSGLKRLFDIKDKLKKIGFFELQTNNRHPLVDDILKYYDEEK